MRRGLMFACLTLAACATANFEGTPIAEWIGAYKSSEAITRQRPSDYDGPFSRTMYLGAVTNVLEVRPVGPTKARIDFMMFYPRGHQCAVSGNADLQGARLVLEADNEQGRCEVSFTREKNRAGEDVVAIRTHPQGENTCYVYCGANARLSASIPISSRRALPKTPVTELDEPLAEYEEPTPGKE